MNTSIQKTLEYNKIIELCCQYTVSQLGEQRLRGLSPSGDIKKAQLLLKQTREADSIYRRFGKSPVDYFEDISYTLERIHAALFLSMGELLKIAACLKVSKKTKDVLKNGNEDDALYQMAQGLFEDSHIENEILRCIISEEEMSDNASPELNRLRRQMSIINDRVRDKLNGIIKNQSLQRYLQDPIITMRNGRYAIPVKAEHRSQIGGLIHDQSSSGQTVYIEPAAVVELGNEYKKLLLDEKKEIERILMGLTAMVAPIAPQLRTSLILLGDLDAIFAKAKLARDTRAVHPKLNDNGKINIINGRHPLLDSDKVVPMSIHLGDDFDTLIITGPNTGGKTVTLKTVGLFCLMAASGLFVPADEGTELAVFDEIFADIGDEQSIEQSLSTFSSHMKNLVSIMDSASQGTLALLDELGAGTDPIEGAALAQAILEHLQLCDAKTVATTHYSEIKAFALTKSGMQNASMEFDVDRLCPTYRLFIGIPGKSNAFEISSRLGLSEHIINRARTYLKGEEVAFEDVLRGAQEQKRLADENTLLTKLELEKATAIRLSVERDRNKLDEEKAKLKERAREESRLIVKNTRREMDELISQLRELKNIDNRELERMIQKSKDALRKQDEQLYTQADDELVGGEPLTHVQVGQTVYASSIHSNASVLKAADSKGMVLIQAGIIKLSVPLLELRAVAQSKQPKKAHQAREILQNVREVKLNLDLRGMLVDDAIMEIDRYIDDCGITGRKEFYCIHGKGTGALKNGVQAYLKRHPKVLSFRNGNYGEGDGGVTVVSLK